MPNHITNVLEINAYKHEIGDTAPAVIDEIMAAVRSERSPFDFERIIPMPPELNVIAGSASENARALFDDTTARRIMSYPWASHCRTLTELRDFLRAKYLESVATPTPFVDSHDKFATLDDLAGRVKSNLTKHGTTDWYGWCPEHWGTKWNAYSVIAGKPDDTTAIFHFETAWAPPMPVLDALAARFPKVNMRLIWCDEGSDSQNRVWWENGTRERDEEEL